MKKWEIQLNFTETEDESISEVCKCEFCGNKIRFYLHKRWIGGENANYLVQDADGGSHYYCKRPTSWSELGVNGIPDGWEYKKSDDDDDQACFTQKKYTRFDK
jgi:hypothetical protein